MALGDMFQLTGRNALVTGGGRGLGRAMALALAESGANVAVVDLDLERAKDASQELRDRGVKSMALYGDVTKEEDAERTVHATVEALGSLDILINNAGVGILGAAEEIDFSDIRTTFEIDVFGIFTFSRAAFKPMSRQKRGNIINIASMAGISVLYPQEHAHYNSAKAAVIMVTKSLAVEWASFGIRVNALAPGYMITPPVLKLQQQDPKMWDFWMSRVPMGRAGNPEELQGAVIYLASDASSYMTGNVLVIDGGYTCL
jgi:NAD(P)-dependent dehydrogenase (short-subunit alcohol dehydrogenase family)